MSDYYSTLEDMNNLREGDGCEAGVVLLLRPLR